MTDIKATTEFLKATAELAVAQYPQYAGHFAGYRLARVKRDVTTTTGLAFIKGEFVIAIESAGLAAFPETMGNWRVTAWSRRNSCDTVLKSSDVEWLS